MLTLPASMLLAPMTSMVFFFAALSLPPNVRSPQFQRYEIRSFRREAGTRCWFDIGAAPEEDRIR